jgi:hypothetical protein
MRVTAPWQRMTLASMAFSLRQSLPPEYIAGQFAGCAFHDRPTAGFSPSQRKPKARDFDPVYAAGPN